jgi:adenylate cyclase
MIDTVSFSKFTSPQLAARPRNTDHKNIADATVLFADIAGFVKLSRELGDDLTFELLDRLMSEFDVLSDWHGVEKIKTVGDGYMAAAGTAGDQDNHAERVARLALDMQDAATRVGEEWGIPIRLRVGVASGPLKAGTMGLNKRNFDIWGSTVNLAARLEGQADVGGILICGACKNHIETDFVCAPRGAIEIRGFGTINAWAIEAESELDFGSAFHFQNWSGFEPMSASAQLP